MKFELKVIMFSRLNTVSKSITGAAYLIASATLLSRVVGLIRDRTFAHYYTAGPVMDAYFAAFKIPDLVYNLLIIGALSAGFIPTFTKLLMTKDDKADAWKLANNVLNIAAISLFVIAIIGIILTPWLAPIIAPGFEGERRDLVIAFTRIMFASPLLMGISMVLGGILQSLRQFLLYSIAPIFYNLGIIFGVVILVPAFGITGIAWGVVLGALLHSALQFYGAYASGYRWKWIINLRNPETRLIGKLMAPRTLGIAVTQLNTVVVTILASLLPIGSVAVYNYANNLQGVPVGIIGISFALAVFPVLSAAAGKNDKIDFIKNISATLRQVLFLIIPSSIVVILLRAQIVRVVLGTGQFDWTATIHTADALALFGLSLFAQSLIPLFARAFYALSNTKTPFVIGVIAELISIIAALLLMKPYGVAGLALASSIGAIINFALLAITLRQLAGPMEEQKLLTLLYKLSVAAIVMALVTQFLKTPLAKIVDMERFWGILSQGLISGTMGLLVYGVICWLLKVEEILLLHASLKKRWMKIWNVQESIGYDK